ncbi:MAG: Gfo/Idh/MocA family protein [Planctomycetota bacterium]|jgi:predicted dehydrogenase
MKVGIVGCGGIARAHVSAWKANGAEVTAVCDARMEAAEALAAECGAEIIHTDVAGMAGEELDAVSICTPPGTHPQICQPLLDAGLPILCEKPLAATEEQARNLAAAVEKSGTPFMTAFCHRWHPSVIKLRELIRSGRLGKVAFFRNIFSGALDLSGDHRSRVELSGGGTMIDTSSHSVDLFRHLVGEVETVSAVTANVEQDIPVEDLGAMTLTSGAATGILLACHSVGVGTATIEFHGTEGTAIITYFSPDAPDLQLRCKGDEAWTEVDCSGLPDRFVGEIGAFAAAVQDGTPLPITAADGLAASIIMSAAYRSAETGQRISL